MTIESDIVARLLAVSGVTDLVAARVYPLILPQGPTYPALVYQRIAGARDAVLEGDPGGGEARIQITAWASSYSGALALAEAVRAALAGGLTLSGHRVGCTLEIETDSLDTDVKAKGRIQDWRVVFAPV